MISLKLNITGLDKLRSKLATAPRQVGQAISRAIKLSAFILEREAKFALTEGPTRAIDTGLLRSQNVVRELSDVRASIYPLVDYAVYVHEGTFKMKARPWMKVAAQNASAEVLQVFDNAIDEALR